MRSPRFANLKWWPVRLMLAGLIVGCGSDEEDSKGAIPMGKIPAAVVKAAQKQLPGVAFDGAIEEKVGGKTTYELKGRDKSGKEQKVRVNREGKVDGAG